jgi:ribose transport system permease protein
LILKRGKELSSKKILNVIADQKILFLVLAIGIFLSFTSKYFLTFENITDILAAMSIEGTIAIGMALIIILGEIDLSVGSTMTLGVTLAVLFEKYGVITGVLAALIMGLIVGFLNGVLVTKFKLPSIAVTLGMMILLSGIIFVLTKEHTVPGTNFAFTNIWTYKVFRIPLPIIILVILIIIFEILLQKTFFGRNILAVGGNVNASRIFGIKADNIKITCFTLLGFLSGLAGVLLGSKLNVATGVIGTNTAIIVITAVLLGGISLQGGEGSIFKAFQGILLIGVLNNALNLLKISAFVQDVIRGLLLILILIIDSINISRRKYL